jgi:hypothetical protein
MSKETIEPTTAEKTPRRRWKYVGPHFTTGVYLPDCMTLINPITEAEANIDVFVNRYPQLEGQLWERVKSV